MNEPRYGRRRLSIADGDELVYRIFQGEELLLERRGTPEIIEGIRAVVEPLKPGMHATVGSGQPSDPVVAHGFVENPDPATQAANIALANAQATAALALSMAKTCAEMFKFNKAVAEEAVAALRTAGAEERAAFQAYLRAQAENGGRPLISGEGVAQIVGNLGELIKQVRGPSNG